MKLSSFQLVFFSFVLLILIGTALLMLPISSASGKRTPFLDSLFTATSASCVTGLVVRDTATYWSAFGKAVILAMIQIGGLGVITLSIVLVMLSGRKISLFQRSLMQNSISASSPGGVIRLTSFIVRMSLLFEAIGALLLSVPMIIRFGFGKGVLLAVFHSVSAFCNAGFDLMGNYTSLTSFVDDPYVLFVIMALIVIGGIGFFTWEDIRENKLRFRSYSTQSKVILVTSAFLIFVPAVLFFILEYEELPLGTRMLSALFQSVTTRTAGFNSTDQLMLSESGLAFTIILMLIGGSPGSTAGGMKTTTVALLALSVMAVFRNKHDVTVFGRRLSGESIRNAMTIFTIYIFLCLFAAVIITRLEDIPLLMALYETASAIGTVGLTTGITPGLHTASRIILIGLMFFGRVGCLTLIYAILPRKGKDVQRLPLDHINVG